MTLTTNTRNAGLAELAEMLKYRDARKLDIVASPATMSMQNGLLNVYGAEQEISLEGVTVTDGIYRPTTVFDESIATRLGIPTAYLKRLRAERPDLYDMNVNGMLHGGGGNLYDADFPGLDKNFMLRLFRGEGETGIARAFLSDSYKIMDDFDALVAVLGGLRDTGIEAQVQSADLTDRRMTVRVYSPEVSALAPELLKGYRSPFTGNEGADNPTVFAGFVISNSEVGNGAFSITPRLIVEVCSNGMTITKDAMRQVHLGGRLETGTVQWSHETQDKAADLIMAKTRDAVKAFMSKDFLNDAIDGITEEAAKPVTDAVHTITKVSKELSFSDDHKAGVLDHFIKGGQMTAGGVMNAITSYVQTIEDADTANTMESQALQAMSLV